MIKSNLMSSRPEKAAQTAAQRAVKDVKIKAKPAKKKSSGCASLLFMLFLLLIASIVYLEIFGIPGFLRGVIPQEVVDFLGLSEETTATQVLRKAGAPQLTAHGTRADDPTIPLDGSVEEIVKTMRPDVYFKNKVLVDYKEQALSNRIPYQKQAFHIMLGTFYKATPDGDGIGYLDLAYQAPNFYFARVVAVDSRTRNFYREQLRAKVVDFIETDSVTTKDGTIEFSVYGNFQQPNIAELKQGQLVRPSKIVSELMALRTLAIANQVRLSGLEKFTEDEFQTHRRVTVRTTTEADYPSLLNFAEALRKSDIAFGVQQFVSRPIGSEKMQSTLEFVLYASVK
ncbi:hypothetical protein R83H12_00812 [Fibrobacteria bacterium R8-3-H12]